MVCTYKRPSLLSRAGSICRDLASLWNPLSNLFSCTWEEGQLSEAKSRYWLPEISLRRAGNFPCKHPKKGWPSYNACVLDPALLEGPEISHIKGRWDPALLLLLDLPRGLVRLYINILYILYSVKRAFEFYLHAGFDFESAYMYLPAGRFLDKNILSEVSKNPLLRQGKTFFSAFWPKTINYIDFFCSASV